MTLTATTVMLSPVAAVLPSTGQAGMAAAIAARPSSDPAPVVPPTDTAEVVTAISASGAERAAADQDRQPDPRRQADRETVQATYRYLQQLLSQATLGTGAPAPSAARPLVIEPAELIGVIAYFEATHALPVEEGKDIDARV